MECPVCKYPNPAGATHCGMCYEVFNRSAADAYLHAAKRDRQETSEPPPASKTATVNESLAPVVEFLKSIDWAGRARSFHSVWRGLKTVLIGVGSLGLLWLIAGFLFDANLWYRLIGKKLSYSFPANGSSAYMASTTENIRSWSERGGRLDTPLEEFQVEEFGNIFFQPEKSVVKNQVPVRLRVKEWIQILHDIRQPTTSGIPLSHTIPLNHPSLAEAHLVVRKNGVLGQRRGVLTARVGKVLPFLVPQFPAGRIRRGTTWSERVEWLDIFSDWKIHWTGTLHWAAGGLEPCFADTCVRLTYQADLQPQLWAAPGWAAKAVRYVEPQISAEGVALFDAAHKRLASNLFSYDGILRIPILDLDRIPRDLRVGRRVKKTPGEIVIRFQNKIDLHKS